MNGSVGAFDGYQSPNRVNSFVNDHDDGIIDDFDSLDHIHANYFEQFSHHTNCFGYVYVA